MIVADAVLADWLRREITDAYHNMLYFRLARDKAPGNRDYYVGLMTGYRAQLRELLSLRADARRRSQ